VNDNLFLALRRGFPTDLDAPAVDTADGARLTYTWRDLDESSAQIANLFFAEELPRNVMGKVQKALLRKQHKGLF